MLLTHMKIGLSALLHCIFMVTYHPKCIMYRLVCVWLFEGFKQVTKPQCVIFLFHIHKMFGLNTEVHVSDSPFKFGY